MVSKPLLLKHLRPRSPSSIVSHQSRKTGLSLSTKTSLEPSGNGCKVFSKGQRPPIAELVESFLRFVRRPIYQTQTWSRASWSPTSIHGSFLEASFHPLPDAPTGKSYALDVGQRPNFQEALNRQFAHLPSTLRPPFANTAASGTTLAVDITPDRGHCAYE